VLDNLQTPPARGAWRQMLGMAAVPAKGPATLRLALPAWVWRDSLAAGLAIGGLAAVLYL
jgi:hypothetical protein